MAVQLTQEMIQGAIDTQNKYGVPASVTLAQIIQESGGKYEGGLSGLAYNYNNLFGIKAGSSWKGVTVALPTTEYKNGTSYTTTANFRVYNSIAESIDDHGKLLTKPIYTNKTAGATNLEEYVSAMGSVYATDPNYSNALLKIINDNNLTQYDNGSLPTSGHSYTADTEEIENGINLFDWKGILTAIIRIIAILVMVALAVVFFMQAFDIKAPSIKNKTKNKTSENEGES